MFKIPWETASGEESASFDLEERDWKDILVALVRRMIKMEIQVNQRPEGRSGQEETETETEREKVLNELLEENAKMKISAEKEINNLKQENQRLKEMLKENQDTTSRVCSEVSIMKEKQTAWAEEEK